MKINFALRIAVLSFFSFLFCVKTNAQEKTLDAAAIAYNHYNSIVKILLVDSAAEKKSPGSGYLGRGSGFFVSDDGLIFTNRHVVKHALGLINFTDYDKENREYYTNTEIYKPEDLSAQHYKINYISKASIIVQVFTNRNGSTSELYIAKIVAIDSTNFDGAILQIVSELNGNKVQTKFNPLQIANSDSTFQGEDLCLCGFPAQYDGAIDKMLLDQSTLTFGKHSGYDYVFNSDYGFIKTDAAINSGNSGGPVFNKYGKVIGLATAANTKTNTGFIAGINGMYYIAQKDTATGRKLEKLGVKYPPTKNVAKTGIVTYPSVVIPNEKILKEIDLDGKNLRRFKGGFWYFKGFAGISNRDEFFLNTISHDINYSYSSNQSLSSYGKIRINSPGSKLNVTVEKRNQVEIGKIFSLWRINTSNKLSLDWTLINLSLSTTNWSNANLVSDTLGGVFVYNSSEKQGRFSSKLGLMYSCMIKKRICVDAYYKFAVGLETDRYSEVANYSYSYKVDTVAYGSNVQAINKKSFTRSSSGIDFFHCFGFNVRYKLFSLGMEYNIGSSERYYYNIPFPYVVKDVTNSTPSFFLLEGSASLYGKQVVKNMSFTLGITLGGNKRWKHLKD